MLKSIYTPLSGGLAQERVLEIIANNLANIDTPGFKQESVTFTLLEPEPERNYDSLLPPANYKHDLKEHMPFRGNEMAYVGVSGVTKDLSQGPAITTHNPTDFMIEGEGYFEVNTTEGLRYTRDGSFTLNRDGALVTKQGHPVQGLKGSVYLRSGQFQVNHRGEVFQDGQMVDRIKIYRFDNDSALERLGRNYYYFDGPEAEQKLLDHPEVRQGFLEASNVNAMKNLTNMILAHRSYEAYQKAVSNYDSMMERSSNTIGEIKA